MHYLQHPGEVLKNGVLSNGAPVTALAKHPGVLECSDGHFRRAKLLAIPLPCSPMYRNAGGTICTSAVACVASQRVAEALLRIDYRSALRKSSHANSALEPRSTAAACRVPHSGPPPFGHVRPSARPL
jgi:hypothetical protein